MLNLGLLLSHPKEFIEGFSYYYPIPEYLLTKYEDVWDWKILSRNRAINWNEGVLEKFKHNWNWKYNGLSNNESIPWSPELLKKFEKNLSWYHLGWQTKIINDPNILAMCLPHWDEWRQEHLFTTFGAKFDKQNHAWVEKNFENWKGLNWKLLSSYNGFPWTADFIRRHAEKLDWEELSWNSGLPWSMEFIYEHLNKWDWTKLSICNSIPWNLEMLDTFKDHLNWRCLSQGESISWDKDILFKFKDRLYWVTTTLDEGGYIDSIQGLYNNPAIVWTPELYEACNKTIENQFKHLKEEEKEHFEESNLTLLEKNGHWTVYQNGSNWSEPYMEMLIELSVQFPEKKFIDWKLIGFYFKNWETYSQEMIDYCISQMDLEILTQNIHYPWHKHPNIYNRLAEYKKEWTGWRELSANKGLKLTEELIEKYEDKWDWELLSAKPSLTPAIIEKYKDRWDWKAICTNVSFKPEIIDKHNEKWDMWQWTNSVYNQPPFVTYNNFAVLLHIPAKGKIEQWIDNDLLEEILIKIVNKPASIFRKNFKEALKEANFDKLFPGIRHDNYHSLLIEHTKEIIAQQHPARFVEELAKKALKLLMREEYIKSIELFKLILQIDTKDKISDLSLYCNALYVLQNDNTGLPVDKDLNHLFLKKCLPFGPQNPAIYFNAACLYAEMNDFDKAYECITLAKKHNFDNYEGMIRDIKNAPMFSKLVEDSRFDNL